MQREPLWVQFIGALLKIDSGGGSTHVTASTVEGVFRELRRYNFLGRSAHEIVASVVCVCIIGQSKI